MRQLFIVMFFVLICSAYGFGQTAGGFAATAVGMGKIDEAIAKCGALPVRFPTSGFYNPPQTSYVKATSTFIVDKDHWSCMWTGARYQWKALPIGSIYGNTSDGDYSFEGNSKRGVRACHNRVLAIYYTEIPEVVIPTPTPTPVATPAPTPQPTPAKCPNKDLTYDQARQAGMIITEEGLCVTPKPPKVEKEECLECPDDVDASVEASMKTRLTGGLTGTAISAGVSCAASGILNKNLGDCLVDAGIAAAGNRVTQVVNPSPDTVKFTANGETKKFRKGKKGEVGDCDVTWKGNMAILTCGDQECMRVPLPNNLNTTVFAIKRGKKTPVKTQTSSQIPIRTGVATSNGGQIPGGGVRVISGNGLPTRPRRDYFVETNETTSGPTTSVNAGVVTETAQPGYVWVTLGDGRKVQIRKPN